MRIQTDGSANEQRTVFGIGGAIWTSREKPASRLFEHDWDHMLDFAAPVTATSVVEVELMALTVAIHVLIKLALPQCSTFCKLRQAGTNLNELAHLSAEAEHFTDNLIKRVTWYM